MPHRKFVRSLLVDLAALSEIHRVAANFLSLLSLEQCTCRHRGLFSANCGATFFRTILTPLTVALVDPVVEPSGCEREIAAEVVMEDVQKVGVLDV